MHDSRITSYFLAFVSAVLGMLFLLSIERRKGVILEEGRIDLEASIEMAVSSNEMFDALPITSLAVRIITSNDSRAGTNNSIFFDIGPLAWKLSKRNHNDFERGADDTYILPLPPDLVLTTEDILWLRLRKKGILGVSGTCDGLGGAWRPQRIHLIVNGVEYARYSIEQWLNSKNSEWIQDVRQFKPDDAARRFVLSLRLVPNSKISWFDKKAAWLATPLFKKRGISGWIPQNLPISCATGIVIRSPAKSADGLATIDLKLERVEVGDRQFILDSQHPIPHTRFIRVEYRHRRNPVPQSGQRARICGEVKWDTDHEGWYEIHPRGSGDLTSLF